MGIVISIIGFLFVFSLIVFVHELGHFLAAKKMGVRVDEFAFGFPPRIWGRKKKGTLYAVNAIPMGGYVKLHGEDGDAKDPDSYIMKSAPKRILILAAGVIMNMVLAWVILFGGYLIGMKPIIPDMVRHEGIVNNLKVTVVEVERDTPADREGIQKGDVIRKVEGQAIVVSDEMIMALQEKLKENGNQKIKVTIEREGAEFEKEFSTYRSKVQSGDEEVEVNRIGIVLEDKGKIRAPFFTAVKASSIEIFNITKLTFIGLGELFGKLVSNLQITDNATGPVGMFIITGSYANQGFSSLIQLAALLSIAIGAFNILPIPGLDGGHILVALLESATRRKFSNKVKNAIQLAGFGALILLVIVITFKDLFRFGII